MEYGGTLANGNLGTHVKVSYIRRVDFMSPTLAHADAVLPGSKLEMRTLMSMNHDLC